MELCHTPGLENRVKFIGCVSEEDLPVKYSQAKLVLFTGFEESFGLVPVEALASGTPVIGPASGGLKETVTNGHNGILIETMTPEKLAEAIDNLLDDKDEYNKLCRNSMESVTKFSWESNASRIDRILDTTGTNEG